MFKCKYCTIEVSLDNVAKHGCFINKSEIFIDDDNNLFYDGNNKFIKSKSSIANCLKYL